MWEKLKEFCDIDAPSGFEGAATDLASKLLENLGGAVEKDKIGNVFADFRCGENRPTILLDAHLDEVGFMVSALEARGFYRFVSIGGIDPRVLPAQTVRFVESGIKAVFTALPPHVLKAGESDKAFDELFLDTGGAEVFVGDVAVFDSDLVYREHDAIGKAIDDRAGFLMIAQALQLLQDKPVNVTVCGSAQEEVGVRGATVAGFSKNPDFCVAVDVTHAKTPDSGGAKTVFAGSGPRITIGPNCDRKMTDLLIETAKTADIPYQLFVDGQPTGTNARAYQIAREGIPTALISLPIKYMHTPNEVLRRSDFEDGAKLLAAFVERLGEVR